MKPFLLLFWLVSAVSSISAAPPELELDPAIARAARGTVAILVDREKETPGRRFRARATIPQEVIDYYSRPPGPATGLLLDSRGNVLTSFYNVSGNVKSIQVVLPSGDPLPARLLARDESDDLALIQITKPPPDLEAPPPRWADPGGLRVGRFVHVVGRSPDPARPTATFGIISALGRNGGRAFQTDAELNYGNVGGPITDLDGSILGLACFVGHRYPLWGLNSGIGFGTRVDTILSVLPQLLSGKDIPPPDRPFLGVGPSEGSAPRGCRIGTVVEDSAADRAGLKKDDIVLSINGEEVEDFLDLRRIISQQNPGDQVVLQVKRGDKQLELKARLGKRTQ